MSPTDLTRTVSALLRRFPVESPPSGAADAAVTIVLREGLHDVEVLLIERAVRQEDPASGQVGLPGGHVDHGDDGLEDTAMRELTEEIGLTREDLLDRPRFLGLQDAPRFGLTVGVFVAGLSPNPPRHPDPSPGEVADIFWMPVDEVRRTVRVSMETSGGRMDVDAVPREGRVLWGFTLRVLQRFLTEADQRSDPATPTESPHSRPNGL